MGPNNNGTQHTAIGTNTKVWKQHPQKGTTDMGMGPNIVKGPTIMK